MLPLLLAILLSVSTPYKDRLHTIRLKVTPDIHAVEVLVGLSNDSYYRTSAIYPDGHQRVYFIDFRDVPSGEFVAEAFELLPGDKQQRSTQAFFFVP